MPSEPQYLTGSVEEVKCACLGHETRLSRLLTLDPPLALAFLRGNHLAAPEPKQENNQGLDWSQVPQADTPVPGLHNSNQRQDRRKVTDHMRVKRCKNRHKIEAQFYEYNCIQGETENS
jgi:hypothetical protein